MKIGVIAHLKHAISDPFAGGLEMHTYSLCNSLRRRGHNVTLFAAAGSTVTSCLEELCDPIEQSTGTAGEKFRLEHRIYLRLMEELSDSRFDIIHNNSLHYLPPALAGILPMPMVTVLHTPPFWEMEGSIKQNKSPNSRFIAVSSKIRDLWSHFTTIDRVLYNGIDLKRFIFAPHSAESPYIVWSGRIVPEKGLHLALAAARLAGLTLRIAGPMSDRRYFEDEIDPLLNERAFYMGHLNQFDLAALIRGARAYIFTPLWEEPYGLVLAEAMACGVPVASFARGAVAEILDETCGIIVPPEDVPALACAARDVQNLSRGSCRKRAEEIADSESMIDQYDDFYRRLILQAKLSPLGVPPPPIIFPDTSGPRALLDHYIAQRAAIASEIPAGLRI